MNTPPNQLQDRNIKAVDFFSLSSPHERIVFLLQYAVLAPSTHNSQPWNFRVGEDFCEIVRNDDHAIIHADPKGRDLFISLGCLIENLVIAAQYFKVFKKVDYILGYPLVARVYFTDLDRTSQDIDRSMEPLLQAILVRVTARGIFENEPVTPMIQEILKRIPPSEGLRLHILNHAEDIKHIAELTQQGLRMAYKDPAFRKEMSSWFNSNFSSKPTGIPGYSVRMPPLLSVIFPWLVRNFDIGKRLGALNYASIASAPAAMVITARVDGAATWLDAGRYAERLMLQANASGYKTSIFTAAIEMGELYKDIQDLLKTADIPQFIIIFGKLNYVQKPNLRIAAQNKIII